MTANVDCCFPLQYTQRQRLEERLRSESCLDETLGGGGGHDSYGDVSYEGHAVSADEAGGAQLRAAGV